MTILSYNEIDIDDSPFLCQSHSAILIIIISLPYVPFILWVNHALPDGSHDNKNQVISVTYLPDSQ
jgi:hypothetical protein